MSTLIPLIGRKSLKARLAYFIMYALLILGGITMVVPFLTLISSSFRSRVDAQTYEIVPKYFHDLNMLKLKYVEQETNYDMALYRGLARSSTALMKDVELPAPCSTAQQTDYYAYLKTLPATFTMLTCRGPLTANPGNLGTHPAVIEFRTDMLRRYGTLAEVEKKHGIPLPDKEQLSPPFENWHVRTFQPDFDLRRADFVDFKLNHQPVTHLIPIAAEATWCTMLQAAFVADVKAAEAKIGVKYPSLAEANLPLRLPKGSKDYTDMWEDCVRHVMPIWFVRTDDTAKPTWARFLQTRFHEIKNYNEAHNTQFARFEDIPLPVKETQDHSLLNAGLTMGEWSDFLGSKDLTTTPPIASIYLDTPEERYRQYLQEKFHKDIKQVNAAYGTNYADFAAVYLPTIPVKVLECQQHAGALRTEFIIRNYRTVTNYLLLHGRAFFNTAIFILLSLFFTLTVNPITAYSLSRFKLRSTNKILLFLLATMAFPAEIAMIPNFLILKELHLLNTYWALVLPGMANGFSIFLLKGMFDGLPQDLYEAAMLDGASEPIIFWKITMPLVKPFLAYLSLGTFIGCYSAFIFALLLCPDPKMWTIMVFLQQMDWADQPVKFAAYVLASIPTLIVFVTCQRIIMRGIVLPTEK